MKHHGIWIPAEGVLGEPVQILPSWWKMAELRLALTAAGFTINETRSWRPPRRAKRKGSSLQSRWMNLPLWLRVVILSPVWVWFIADFLGSLR